MEARKKAKWRESDKFRPNSYQRGYDSVWVRARKMFLRRNPLCARCAESSRIKVATLVHHKKPVDDYPELRLDPQNMMGLCRDCHEIIEGRKRWEL
jgi:5-methylcytosine-specific restriction enzyme A